MEISFLQKYYFQDKLGQYIDTETKLKEEIPRQWPDDASKQIFDGTSSALSGGVKGLFSINFLMNIIL